MPVGGGDNRDYMRPTNVLHNNTIGDHRASFSALNVRNPRPGYRYFYENSAVRGGAKVLQRLNRGAELVEDTDSEQWGGALPNSVQAQNGSFKAFGDVVLMRVRNEVYNEWQREKQELADRALNKSRDDFRDRGEMMSRRLGPMAPADRDLYYSRPNHGVTFAGEGEE